MERRIEDELEDEVARLHTAQEETLQRVWERIREHEAQIHRWAEIGRMLEAAHRNPSMRTTPVKVGHPVGWPPGIPQVRQRHLVRCAVGTGERSIHDIARWLVRHCPQLRGCDPSRVQAHLRRRLHEWVRKGLSFERGSQPGYYRVRAARDAWPVGPGERP